MKKRRLLLPAIVVIVLVFIFVIMMHMLNQKSNFTGNRIKNPDYYLLECQIMNGVDSHTIHMGEGDVLGVKISVDKGRMSVAVGMEGEDSIYKSNEIESGEFEVKAQVGGDYLIKVNAHKFKGKVEFTLKQK
jgi:ABC-type cobalt transport system substrate-binding protein